MAVSFLTAAQRDRYGRYPDVVTPDDLSRCFHLSDDDRAFRRRRKPPKASCSGGWKVL